ncbi:homoserine O-acetyltransferase [Alteromonas sp. C1M14]|uniref:E22 family MetX-like putative esterase n=1 Tax=Alteromonas sp. C1M14 TaxID=2841567 RepID=UPI001C096365|nr:homoserine O-acetyltransferase [Alteromonas sp. C1M14]MBU2978841.1 homoserine O-acetyltransferase [Alteromonas sp. C1M14]
MKKIILTTLCCLFITCAYGQTQDDSLLTEKRRFHLAQFTTFGGQVIPNVNVGWESYGKLNEKKDNVVLITHYFSGNSHAAGKYHPSDKQAGYWDALIGPGKAIDTNRFYVLSVDSLVNLSANNPNVITTGPASINPTTGKPYGLDFPVVTIGDFVNVQKALLESLGISSLYAVVGPSMGSMQAIEWAATYPSWVGRMIAVIPAAQSDAWTTAALEQWAMPIRLDANWNEGNYYEQTPPTEGLTAALMLITQQALSPAFFNQQGDSLAYSPLEAGPLEDIRQSHSIVNWLYQRAKSRAGQMDANHLLYLVRACQLFVAGHQGSLQNGLKNIQAKTLFIPAQSDLLLMPYMAELSHGLLQAQGNNTHIAPLEGQSGHLEGLLNIQEKAKTIRQFLENE